MQQPRLIRILGAGVAGLTAAIALSHDGHRVELFDDHFAAPAVGTALGLFPPAQRVLKRIGVLDRVQARSAAPRNGRLIGANGRTLATIPAGGGILVARSDLVEILSTALPSSVRRFQQRIEDVRPLKADSDLLVGADGVHSLVRRSGWPGSSPQRHGVTVLRGTTPNQPPEVSETWGGGWLFGITPLAGDTGPKTNWFACIPEHRTESRKDDLAHLREIVGGVREPIDDVLRAAQPDTTLVHGILTAPAVLPAREHVALVGDAAHAMAPNLGHGANTARQDSEALATAIRTAPTISAALRRYAMRRTAAGQGWRIGSAMMLQLAMAEQHTAMRDHAVGTAAALMPNTSRHSLPEFR